MAVLTIDSVKIENSKVSYRDIYFRLWACRDFEISHVWQRAIFLTAFLIACFAGYGGLFVAVITAEHPVLSIQTANGIAFSISFVGIVISLLWIMMAKGSKMWYENYEQAIESFRSSHVSAFDANVSGIAGMKLHDIQGYEPPYLSNWIWSTRGGNFSVSRINVFIGQFSLCIWGVLMCVHILFAKSGCTSIRDTMWVGSLLTDWRYMFCLSFVALLFFWLFARQNLKGRGA